MSDELRAAAERLRGIEGPTFHRVNGGERRHIVEREYVDAVTLAMAWLAEHPADDADHADVNWLMDGHGFAYSSCGTALVKHLGGGWEVVCGVREHRGEVEVKSLSLYFVYSSPNIEAAYTIEDDPTRRSVRRLLAALGAEATR